MSSYPYTRYQLQISSNDGEIILGYVENVMHTFTSTMKLTADQARKLLKNVGTVEELQVFVGAYETITCKAMPVDLSYENFWSLWPGIRGNKKKAEKIWDKMSETERTSCLWSLIAYKKYIKRNQSWYNPQWPDTYLRNERYQDEWR